MSPRTGTSASDRPDPALGIFDTVLVQHHRPIEAHAHIHRLARSAREVYGIRVDRREVQERVHLAAGRGPALQRLRLVLPATRQVELTADALEARVRDPWTLWLHPVVDGMGCHKWVDRTMLDAPAGEAAGPAVDPLLVDGSGLVLETGRGNVFVVADGVVSTPPLDGRILPGVVRALVVDALGELSISCVERPVSVAELAQADEVFVTNSIGGVRAVTSIRGVHESPEDEVTLLADAAVERAWSARG